ncbi:hypothetical protein TTHERM_00266520 (macronuclear) [Tetrahymena thermophila SB210]|uniref:Uncharacterized protein n=1 Tax=Tetrahymena thermophila (strain SB210) TaxID=312017 RepID=I7LUP5_TETTS|nr:hypothetical protein TTHERM_00266520 [Tetrahymena thermophila SB210]EAR95642.2 hypothetical protein TTHERM_00266520 [Tetrahymena thermophila SB210]|eukprot:XP_001015887.2 hypothetical protein TTHERM_00266520 [Tetrahymena thermophila SB210]
MNNLIQPNDKSSSGQHNKQVTSPISLEHLEKTESQELPQEFNDINDEKDKPQSSILVHFESFSKLFSNKDIIKLQAEKDILQKTLAQTVAEKVQILAEKEQMLAEKDLNLAKKDEDIKKLLAEKDEDRKKLLALISQYQSQGASNNVQNNEVAPLSENQAVFSNSEAQQNQEQF